MSVQTLGQNAGVVPAQDFLLDGLRLEQAIAKGLPTLPGFVLELNSLLDAEPRDLKRVSQLIRTDPSLTAQVLRKYNTLPYAPTVGRFEEAVESVGEARLRVLALSCPLMESAQSDSPILQTHSFWEHSLLTAIVSQRLAESSGYPDPEKAYLAGLLHDVGEILFLGMPEMDGDPPHHTRIGRAIAMAWDYPPDLVEAIECHHRPAEARIDPRLCGIVAFADHYEESSGLCEVPGAGGTEGKHFSAGAANTACLLMKYLPELPVSEAGRLAMAFERELPALRIALVDGWQRHGG